MVDIVTCFRSAGVTRAHEVPVKRHAEGILHVALAVSLALAGGLSQVGPASADAQTRTLRPVQSSPHSTSPQSKAPDARTSDGKMPDSKSPEAKPPEVHRGDRGKSKPDRAAFPRPASIKTLAQKTKVLADLHERLVAADSAEAAEVVADTIEQMWLYSGSDTTNLLMERAMKSLHGKQPELALKILDGVVALKPNFAEGWNRRAYVHFSQKDYRRALIDLRRVLAIEPRHFKAINGLATILREFGEKRSALKAYRMLLDIHPFSTDAQQAVKELEREVEGESL